MYFSDQQTDYDDQDPFRRNLTQYKCHPFTTVSKRTKFHADEFGKLTVIATPSTHEIKNAWK